MSESCLKVSVTGQAGADQNGTGQLGTAQSVTGQDRSVHDRSYETGHVEQLELVLLKQNLERST